ncbi:MAG: BamA/TamA family outer membrane protein [Gammaproteobacteria bacterium]|nr:BamA/TamA family outer membrane protein [Gammaproteobacteria bacterium]
MAKSKNIFWLICFVCYSSTAGAVTHIRSISFAGNEVTQESVLRRQMYISEGDVLDINTVEKSVQAIRDLALFKTVTYYLTEDYSQTDKDEQLVDLVIQLKEKIYLLVLPRIRQDGDDTHLGVQLHWDNMYGLDHQMRFLVENRGTTEGVAENRQRIKYVYPNVNGSSYELAFKLINMKEVDDNEASGSIVRQDQNFSVGVSKWLNEQGRKFGWFIGTGLNFRLRDNEDIAGTPLDTGLEALIFELRYGYNKVHTYDYNRGGREFGYSLDVSDHVLGSDSEFFKHVLYYRSYYRFESRPHDNLNVQTILGHSTDDVMGDAAFTLGSSDDLRGYRNDRFEGNTVLLVNIEYLMPSDWKPAFRYVYFIDFGNTYDDIHDMAHEPLKTGLGAGFRWKIRKLVKVDLRADLGYGVDDEDFRFTFGLRHMF